MIRTEVHDRELPCKLTEHEKVERGLELTSTLEKMDDLKSALAAERFRVNAEIEALRKRASELRRQISTGEELRHVSCEERLDEAQVVAVRLDTGEIIAARVATDEELQMDIPGFSKAERQKAAAQTETEKRRRRA